MIGRLPTTINVHGIEHPIRTDYRDCLVIMQAFEDPELTPQEQVIVVIECLYCDDIAAEDTSEAYTKALEFLDGGTELDTNAPKTAPKPRLYSWEQDEQIIFSAINKVAGREIRSESYMHWWTFTGLFNEIGEGTFATVVSIRKKRMSHQKLEKWEQEFYRNNKKIVDLRLYKPTKEEMDDLDRILGIGGKEESE